MTVAIAQPAWAIIPTGPQRREYMLCGMWVLGQRIDPFPLYLQDQLTGLMTVSWKKSSGEENVLNYVDNLLEDSGMINVHELRTYIGGPCWIACSYDINEAYQKMVIS